MRDFHHDVLTVQIHAANVAAVTIPVGAIMMHAPLYLAVGTGLLSFIFYAMTVIDKAIEWRKRWKHRKDAEK